MSKGKGKAPDVVSGRQRKNSALLSEKKVVLDGSERAFILRAIERTPAGQRTSGEQRLKLKVI